MKGFVAALEGLKRKHLCLKNETINVVAHSQGTIITMAALNRGMELDNAVFMGSRFDKESTQNVADFKSAADRVGSVTNLWWPADDTARYKGGIGGFGLSPKMITSNVADVRLADVDHFGPTGWWAGMWLSNSNNSAAVPVLDRVMFSETVRWIPSVGQRIGENKL